MVYCKIIRGAVMSRVLTAYPNRIRSFGRRSVIQPDSSIIGRSRPRRSKVCTSRTKHSSSRRGRGFI
jgi:hypothetical protein